MLYEIGIIASDDERALHGPEGDAARNRRWLAKLDVGDVLKVSEPENVMWSPSDASARLRRHGETIKAKFTVHVAPKGQPRAVIVTRAA